MKYANSSEKIRVMLVDDHVLVRVGLACTVNVETDMEIVAEVAEGRQALEQYRKHRPDVVVMDLRLPDMDGVDVMKALQKEFGTVICIFLSSYDGGDEIARAMQCGANGYVLKSMASEHLLNGIRAVAEGKKYLPSAVSHGMTERMNSDLSDRELGVLRLIARGQSNKQIAAQLGIVEGTVKAHLVNIFAKLGTVDRAQSVAIAIKRQILQLE